MNEALLVLYRHKTWATLALIDFCKGVDDAVLDATTPGTYGTIRDTLRHLVLCRRERRGAARSGGAVGMKALTFQGEGDVKVREVPKPSVAASNDALIKVTLGAVCGSDLHILHGHTPMNPGTILGHEFVGVVEEVGPEVKRFKPGDRVVSSFFTSCGHCTLCRKGWFNQRVEKGTFGHGA